ncbi:MAG: hypothetical protein E3J56_12695 [Candidatus Aminicenantes bacterium]|nr:MAG: hypothetical protein E3J56_12695 [Candidatus Aminicenantes bacterium]
MDRHSEETIHQAKELFEDGASYPAIAAQLGIRRSQTIYDWKRKFGWVRTKTTPVPTDIKSQIDIWEFISTKAMGFLQDMSFTSMSDALRTYDKAQAKLAALKRKNEKKSPDKEFLDNLGIEDSGSPDVEDSDSMEDLDNGIQENT